MDHYTRHMRYSVLGKEWTDQVSDKTILQHLLPKKLTRQTRPPPQRILTSTHHRNQEVNQLTSLTTPTKQKQEYYIYFSHPFHPSLSKL